MSKSVTPANLCFNYFKIIKASDATINELNQNHLDPRIIFPSPYEITPSTDLSGYDMKPLFAWRENTYGSRWMYNDNIESDIHTIQFNENRMEATFISAWNPPLGFYDLLARKYPDLEFYYEYHEPKAGICGHGRGGGIITKPQTTFYKYDNIERYETIKTFHKWTYEPFDPFYEKN
jgi:hypothetical protein